MPSTVISDTRLGHKLIPEEVRATIGEFIAEIGQIPSLLCAILYGSTVRDELHDESDIDVFLLFDTAHNPEFGEEVSIVARICVEAAMRTDSYYEFSFVVSNLAELETMDQDYLRHVVKEGIVIWSRPELVIPLSAFASLPDVGDKKSFKKP
jgi:predicted nucleotidyltransferase